MLVCGVFFLVALFLRFLVGWVFSVLFVCFNLSYFIDSWRL